MICSINLKAPHSWQSLSDSQLRFVHYLLRTEHTLPQVMALALFRWAKVRILHREGAVFIVKHRGKRYPISALQVAEASRAMKWLGDIPGFPVRLSRIGLHRPVRADFQNVSFEDFLALDNLYQGYLNTQRADLLREMAKIMYQSKRIRLNAEEEICTFYWFTSVKQMFARMFRHFLKPLSTDDSMPNLPSLQQLQESMNAQIRALTGGDITKEREVLKMDCWRALTELDAKARDSESIKSSLSIPNA